MLFPGSDAWNWPGAFRLEFTQVRASDIPGFSRAPLERDESLSAYESSLRFYERTVNYELHFLAADRLKATAGVQLHEIWTERVHAGRDR